MSPNSVHDLPAPHIDGVQHRREVAPKIKEPKPLFSREPLPHARQRKPSTRPVKKRRVVVPTTSALTFDPKRSLIPSGKQDPAAYSRPSTSESSASSQDEQPSPSTSYFPDTPCTEVCELSLVPPHECHGSPIVCFPPSPSAPSDRSPCPVEVAIQIHPMYVYGGQGFPQPPVHPDYGYTTGPYPDRPAQNYPMQHFDAGHGRGPVPHGVPAYPDSNDYPHGRRF